MPKATVRANARTLPDDKPRFRIAHLFQDESLRSLFRSIEHSMPEISVLPASSFAASKVIPDEEDGFISAKDVVLNLIDQNLSALRYLRINGVMTKDDRQTYRVFEKMRAAVAHRAGKEDVR